MKNAVTAIILLSLSLTRKPLSKNSLGFKDNPRHFCDAEGFYFRRIKP